MFPVTWNKKHSSKQVVSMISTLGRDFRLLQLLILKVCEILLLTKNKKLVVYFGLYQSKIKKLLLIGGKFSFPYENI